MKPFSSIFAGGRGRGSTAIGLFAITAIAAVVIAVVLANGTGGSAEADSLTAPAAQVPYDPPTNSSVFVKIKANGDDIVGESPFADRSGVWTDVFEYNQSLTTATDRGSGLATGRRQHSPIVFTKRIDKSSPLLFQALAQNKTIEATFEFERVNSDSAEVEVYYKVVTTDGRITGIRKNAGLVGGDTETISITFTTIEEEDLINSTQFQDTVSATAQ